MSKEYEHWAEVQSKDFQEIRLKLTEIDATLCLQYAALAIAIAVVWATLVSEIGHNVWIWILEGVIASGGVYAGLVSLFWGSVAGRMGGKLLDQEVEKKLLEKTPKDDYWRPKDEADHLSRIAWRYWEHTKEMRPVGLFFTVRSPILGCFIMIGGLVGFGLYLVAYGVQYL